MITRPSEAESEISCWNEELQTAKPRTVDGNNGWERMKCNKTVLAQDSFNGLLLTKTMIHFVIWDFISAIRFEIDTTGSLFRDSSKNIKAIYAMKVTGQSVNM